MKNNKDKNILIIMNSISLVCGILAIVLFALGDVDLKDPVFWVMCLIVLSSLTSIVKLNLKPKTKKIVKE